MTNGTAIVTGASGGLGHVIARALLDAGLRVVAHYFSNPEGVRALADYGGERILPLRADLADSRAVEAMARAVAERWGGADALVNNAGITRDALLLRLREEEWDAVQAVDCAGVFHAIRAFAPLMRDGGHIVNISSYSGLKGKEGQAAYSAAKAALLGLTKSAAAELAERGVRVNALLPGYLPAGMGPGAGAAMERAREESLLKALADPEEAARFIVYLIGTRNITGQVFCLDSRII